MASGWVFWLGRDWGSPETGYLLLYPRRRLGGGDRREVTTDGLIRRAILAISFPHLWVPMERHVALLVGDGRMRLTTTKCHTSSGSGIAYGCELPRGLKPSSSDPVHRRWVVCGVSDGLVALSSMSS